MGIFNDCLSVELPALKQRARQEIDAICRLSAGSPSLDRSSYNRHIITLNQILAALVQQSKTEEGRYDVQTLSILLNEKPQSSVWRLFRSQPSLVELMQEEVHAYVSQRDDRGRKQSLLEALKAYQAQAQDASYFCRIQGGRIECPVAFLLGADGIEACFNGTNVDIAMSASELDLQSMRSFASDGSGESLHSCEECTEVARGSVENYSAWAENLVQHTRYGNDILATLGGFLDNDHCPIEDRQQKSEALCTALSRKIAPIRPLVLRNRINFEAHDLFAQYDHRNPLSQDYLDEYHRQIEERLDIATHAQDQVKMALWRYMLSRVDKQQRLLEGSGAHVQRVSSTFFAERSDSESSDEFGPDDDLEFVPDDDPRTETVSRLGGPHD